MKNNEIILNVTLDDLNSAVAQLESGNTKYLMISNNLFSIKDIYTCLHIKDGYTWNDVKYESFKFSYNDENLKNMIVIKYSFENSSCLEFLKTGGYLTKEQINSISAKINNTLGKINFTNEVMQEKKDQMFYSEALIIMTSAINKEDFEMVRQDFESKFDSWKNRKTEINNEAIIQINKLYNLLLKIKLSEKL